MSQDGGLHEVNLLDPQLAACPQEAYSRLQRECPVARVALVGSPIISRYEDVMWAMRHPEIFSSAMDLQVALGTERPMIPQQIDPPEQTRYRKLLDPRFSRKRMLEIEPEVREVARRLIDGFADAGACEFDRDSAIPLPCTAFLSLMGLPHEELELFLRLKDGIIRPQTLTDDMERTKEIRKETGQEIYAYFAKLIDERKRARAPTTTSSMPSPFTSPAADTEKPA